MQAILDENSTRQSIIMLLKKNSGMTIDDLSKRIGITPMGVRQHLLSLEKKGLVMYVTKKHGIGRPGFVYMLTDSADNLFRKSYDKFAMDILREVKKNDGMEKVNRIFSWRKDRLLKQKKEALSGLNSIDDAMHGLKNIMEEEGYLVDLEKEGDKYLLRTYNCPISKVAVEFSDACSQELQLYRELLNRNVTMIQCMGQGSPACIFSIPAV